MHKKILVAIAIGMLSVLYAQTRLDSGIMYIASASDQFFGQGISGDVVCSTLIRPNVALRGGISLDRLAVKNRHPDYVMYLSPFIGLGYEKDLSKTVRFRVSYQSGITLIPPVLILRFGTEASTGIRFRNDFEIEPVIGITVFTQDMHYAVPFYEIKAGLRFGYTFVNLKY